MAIWWTSDPHFMHKNVIRFCDRPFANTDEMDAALVANYNKYVKEDDTLIFVGDLSLGKKNRIRPILNSIKCKNKILVQGNHDTKGALPRDCFTLIVNRMSVMIAGHVVIVSHYPFKWPWWKHTLMMLKGRKPRYRDRRPSDNGHFQIHGHTHSSEKQVKRMIHVGVDAWNYKPVSNDEIAQMIAKTISKEKAALPKNRIAKEYKALRNAARGHIRRWRSYK